MKCRNARKLVSEFIDGLKSDTKRLELEKHLSGCEECDKYASQLTRCMDLLHRAPRETTGDNFAWKVRLKLNQERNSVRERSASYGTLIRSWNLRFATTAASAVIAPDATEFHEGAFIRSVWAPSSKDKAPWLAIALFGLLAAILAHVAFKGAKE